MRYDILVRKIDKNNILVYMRAYSVRATSKEQALKKYIDYVRNYLLSKDENKITKQKNLDEIYGALTMRASRSNHLNPIFGSIHYDHIVVPFRSLTHTPIKSSDLEGKNSEGKSVRIGRPKKITSAPVKPKGVGRPKKTNKTAPVSKKSNKKIITREGRKFEFDRIVGTQTKEKYDRLRIKNYVFIKAKGEDKWERYKAMAGYFRR